MILKAENISFSYSPGGRQILSDVSLTLGEGEIMTILGPNGAGKSTLLNLLAALNTPTSGKVYLCGRNAAELRPREIASVLSYVPQSHTPAFAYTVFDFVLMGRAPRVGILEKPKAEDFEVVRSVLDELGITELSDKPYTEISGGERQQATIARALVQQPKAILFDEPTAHLDYGNQLKTLRVIKALREKGYAVIITTHTPDHAIMLGGTTAILDRTGHLSVGDSESMITEDRLRELYSADLMLKYIDSVGRKVCIPPEL